MARPRSKGPRHVPAVFVRDPLTGRTAEIRSIQPHAALKPYRCPGCRQEIAPGVGHVVVVPLADPAERRHWHGSCWERRATRQLDW